MVGQSIQVEPIGHALTQSTSKPSLAIAANARPRVGGQGLNLFHMAEALRTEFEVSVYCRAPYPGLATTIPPEARLTSRWWSLPLVRRLRDWQAWHGNFIFDRSVAAQLTATQVFHGAVGQSLRSLHVAKKLGARTVLDAVTLHVDVFQAAQQQECRRFGIRPPMHRWEHEQILAEYQTADLIRVMSHVAKRTFLEHGIPEEKIVVASPSFPLEEFPQANFSEPVFRVCYVGLVEPWKGFHHLVEAFDRLRLHDAELVLWGGCGSRPVTQYMQLKTAGNPSIRLRPQEVRSVGFAEVYGKASVLVLPSLADGFGYVVGEAMACGIPVIVSSMTGAADLVEEGVSGYIVPPGDVEAIAARLEYLAKNPAVVRRLGQAARAAMSVRTPQALSALYAGRIRRLIS